MENPKSPQPMIICNADIVHHARLKCNKGMGNLYGEAVPLPFASFISRAMLCVFSSLCYTEKTEFSATDFRFP